MLRICSFANLAQIIGCCHGVSFKLKPMPGANRFLARLNANRAGLTGPTLTISKHVWHLTAQLGTQSEKSFKNFRNEFQERLGLTSGRFGLLGEDDQAAGYSHEDHRSEGDAKNQVQIFVRHRHNKRFSTWRNPERQGFVQNFSDTRLRSMTNDRTRMLALLAAFLPPR